MSKTVLVLICSLFFVLLSCKTPQPHNNNAQPTKKAFIPYSVGTFWVYESIDHQNAGIAPFVDTLRVLRHEQTANGLKVDLNQGKWVAKAGGDSIYILCQTRGGGGFEMPLYHRSESESTYSSCKGDVMIQVIASKLAEPQVVKGKTYKNCYQFDLKPYERVIVADGVGVIKREYFDLNKKLMTEQLLVNYTIK